MPFVWSLAVSARLEGRQPDDGTSTAVRFCAIKPKEVAAFLLLPVWNAISDGEVKKAEDVILQSELQHVRETTTWSGQLGSM